MNKATMENRAKYKSAPPDGGNTRPSSGFVVMCPYCPIRVERRHYIQIRIGAKQRYATCSNCKQTFRIGDTQYSQDSPQPAVIVEL